MKTPTDPIKLEAHRAKRRIWQKGYYSKRKDYVNEMSRLYYKNNPDKMKAKSRRKYLNSVKKRLKNDPLFIMSERIKSLIRGAFKRKGFKKNTKTAAILGCSSEEFIRHIESQFEPWMNWDNYGLYNGEFNYGFDIDHIIPLSTAKTEEDVIKLNHYTNLQPLCSHINRNIKRDKLDFKKEEVCL